VADPVEFRDRRLKSGWEAARDGRAASLCPHSIRCGPRPVAAFATAAADLGGVCRGAPPPLTHPLFPESGFDRVPTGTG